MLANDPHLLVEFPSVWYEMHLVAAGLDVIGVTIPGVPFVVIGHNRRIAWGFTNSGADVQDLTLERLDVARKRYMSARRMAAGEGDARGHPGARAFGHGALRCLGNVARPDHRGRRSLDWEAPPAWMTPAAGSGAAAAQAQVGAGLCRCGGRRRRRHRVELRDSEPCRGLVRAS